MADENPNQPESKSPAGLMDRVKEEIKPFQQKLESDLAGLKTPQKTALYKSIFRVKHDETPRSRSLGVLSNVFLHLHPARVNRDAVRYGYT